MVVFDTTAAPSQAHAVYLEARAAEVDAAELEDALAVYSDKSMRSGLIAWTRPDVTGDAAHRMYRARISAASVLAPKDSRAPISL